MTSRIWKANLQPEDLTAVIDTREKNPLELSPLCVERRSLVTGDYTVKGLEHLVAIERKSLSDLLACIGQQRERFEREVQRLLAYPVRALVVEAAWAELEAGKWTTSQVTASAAMGSCLGWVARGLPVLLATDHAGAGRCVSRLLWVTARRRWREDRELIGSALDPRRTGLARPTLCES